MNACVVKMESKGGITLSLKIVVTFCGKWGDNNLQITLNGPLVMFYFLTLVMVMTVCFLDFTKSNLKEGGRKGGEGEESVSDSPPTPFTFLVTLGKLQYPFGPDLLIYKMGIMLPFSQNFHANYEILHITAIDKDIKHFINFEKNNSIILISNAILEL